MSLNNIHFTVAGVLRVIKKLNVKSAGGPDFLPPILLKNIAPSIAHPLASMFELFFDCALYLFLHYNETALFQEVR